MKLIDLLVKELPRRGGWPEGAEIAVQDADSQICFSSHSDVYANKGKTDWYGGDWGDGDWSNPFIDTIADDRHECIVSRKQYEAALAASKAAVGHNGWIEWNGGECPVDSDAIVEVKYRKPNPYQFNNDRAGDYIWLHTGSDGDIIAYRLQQPGIDSRAKDDRLEQDLNECIGQEVDMPEWNGDGLPPVGCECEWQDKNTKQWQPVKVVYSSEWVTVVREINEEKGDDLVEIAIENYDDDSRRKFRPLRTEAEKARIESIAAIIAILDKGNSTHGDAEDIYEAISAGKIPGIKLEVK